MSPILIYCLIVYLTIQFKYFTFEQLDIEQVFFLYRKFNAERHLHFTIKRLKEMINIKEFSTEKAVLEFLKSEVIFFSIQTYWNWNGYLLITF